jgi:hypothetical protein
MTDSSACSKEWSTVRLKLHASAACLNLQTDVVRTFCSISYFFLPSNSPLASRWFQFRVKRPENPYWQCLSRTTSSPHLVSKLTVHCHSKKFCLQDESVFLHQNAENLGFEPRNPFTSVAGRSILPRQAISWFVKLIILYHLLKGCFAAEES